MNIYDTTVTDEDEALVQVINHGSVHHAGFLSERTIFALSHDEHFSVYPATDPDDASQEPEPVHFGDVRDPLGCEYVAQLCFGAQGSYIAAGNKMYVYFLFCFVLGFFCIRARKTKSDRHTCCCVWGFVGWARGCLDLLTMSCSDNRLDLVPLISSPSWKLDRDNLWRLPRAHCEEVVRSVYLDEQVSFLILIFLLCVISVGLFLAFVLYNPR